MNLRESQEFLYNRQDGIIGGENIRRSEMKGSWDRMPAYGMEIWAWISIKIVGIRSGRTIPHGGPGKWIGR